MPRLIKRYENRKLYDTEASAYVSQRDIARLVRQGETVQVVDNVTGEDLTAHILTQIILEEGKRGDNLLPADLLHDLVRRGSEVAASSLGQFRDSVDHLVQQSIDRLGQLVGGGPERNEMEQLREQMQRLEERLQRLAREMEQSGLERLDENGTARDQSEARQG